MNTNLTLKTAVQILLFFSITHSLQAASFELRLRYLESAKYSEGEITFDPYIREVGSPPRFHINYGFRFKGKVDDGVLQGLNYEFGRGESELMEIICKMKDIKDGESLKIDNLINIKRIGPNLVGVVFRERNGVFTSFKFNFSFETAFKFSTNVSSQGEWLRSRFVVKEAKR